MLIFSFICSIIFAIVFISFFVSILFFSFRQKKFKEKFTCELDKMFDFTKGGVDD